MTLLNNFYHSLPYLAQEFLPFLIFAFLLGLVVGWYGVRRVRNYK